MRTGALGEEVARNILHIDGDDHRRLRNLVNPAFTPRAADRWRPVMRELPRAAVRRGRRRGRVRRRSRRSARPYPSMTIATVVGAPIDDAERLASWSRWIQLQFDGPTLAEHRAEVERACEEFYAYLDALIVANAAPSRATTCSRP